jgi:hypothetical protein
MVAIRNIAEESRCNLIYRMVIAGKTRRPTYPMAPMYSVIILADVRKLMGLVGNIRISIFACSFGAKNFSRIYLPSLYSRQYFHLILPSRSQGIYIGVVKSSTCSVHSLVLLCTNVVCGSNSSNGGGLLISLGHSVSVE